MSERAAVASRVRADRLLEILDLTQIERNLFLGDNESRGGFRLFGGQVLAQATMAAYRTVEQLSVHSLHAYFLRGGKAERPVLYEVERIRDGRSFATRRVVAVQGGDAIFNMDVSFQVDETGFEHAHPIPNVPPPEELEDDAAVAASLDADDARMSPMVKIDRPFRMRSVFRLGSKEWGADRFWNPVWIKFSWRGRSERSRTIPLLAGLCVGHGNGLDRGVAAPAQHAAQAAADGESRPCALDSSRRAY